MREKFLSQMETLNRSLVEMGTMVEESINNTIKAMNEHNMDIATRNIEADKDIDQKMRVIESLCIKLFLRQQPVASDLRMVSAALKMVSDLERIGDQSSSICELLLTLSPECDIASVPHIGEMANAVKKMVKNCVSSFVNQDLDVAYRVIDSDDVVDVLFSESKKFMMEKIRQEDIGDYALDLMMIAKYLERIGDHTVNVSQWIIFASTGEKNGVNYLTSEEDKMEDK